MKITIDLQGDKELMAKLKRLENPTGALQKGMENFVIDIRKPITKYAPLSQANRSPGVNGYSWYVRRDGVHTTTGRHYKVSQDMANKWSFETQRMGFGIRTTIKNDADYSGFVIGKRQTWFHAARKWINAPKYVENSGDKLLANIRQEVDKELNK